MDFVIGGVAACTATILCNPFEVIRTRQQLQGERRLNLKPITALSPDYRTVRSAVRSIVRSDGLRGLQKGLAVSLTYTFLMNAWRMGLFDAADRSGWTRDRRTGRPSTERCMLWSMFSGVAGLTAAMPLLVVRTQLQTVSSDPATIGFQRKYKNAREAFRKEFGAYGVRGLWRGYWGAVPRACVSAMVQLTVFSRSKEFFGVVDTTPIRIGDADRHSQNMNECVGDSKLQQQRQRSLARHCALAAAATVTGLLLVLVLTPFDVVSTRMFTQPLTTSGRGVLYGSAWQCVVRTVRREGACSLYRGFGANVLATVPHTLVQMVLWQELKEVWASINGERAAG